MVVTLLQLLIIASIEHGVVQTADVVAAVVASVVAAAEVAALRDAAAAVAVVVAAASLNYCGAAGRRTRSWGRRHWAWCAASSALAR